MTSIHPHTQAGSTSCFLREVRRYSFRHKCPSIIQKLYPIDNCSKGKNSFLQQSYWVYKPHLRAGPMPSNRSTKRNSRVFLSLVCLLVSQSIIGIFLFLIDFLFIYYDFWIVFKGFICVWMSAFQYLYVFP